MEADPEFQDTVPQRGPGSSGSGSRPAGPWEPPSLEIMQGMLPAYEFIGVLGRGGMGVVYKARQMSLDRLVAIKVLPGDLIDDDDVNFVERFKQEARTMARMNHPAIVGVFDFGETSNGLLYFVMEFVDGTDVARMIVGSGALPPPHALAITAHVCDALAYAHSHGVVHRDIKPANVLINMDGQVKVADFGLAKASDSKELGLTKSNVAMGTPDFVAPEALIAGLAVDGRADLYAIGVMLYQMLTGEIPRGMWSMPSTKIGADPRFDAIIARAMQTDREMRYQTAHEVRTDLDRIITMPIVKAGGEGRTAVPKSVISQQRPSGQRPVSHGPRPSSQKPASAFSKAQQPPPRQKSQTGLFVGVGAVAIIGLGAFLMLPGEKKGETGSAVSAAMETSANIKPATPTGYPGAKASPAGNNNNAKAPVPRKPPDRLFTFTNRSYKLIMEKADWATAMKKAESMGAHLVTVTNKEEDEWLKGTIGPFLSSSDILLVGGQRKTLYGPWEWITSETFGYTGWKSGVPDGNSNSSMVLGVRFDAEQAGWDDVSPTTRGPFLVEWDSFGTAPPGLEPKRSVNLLTRVDERRDVLKGRWKKITNGMELEKPSGPAVLEFNYVPPEEYNFSVDFTPKGDGNNVNLHLSAGGQSFTWTISPGTSRESGFALLDGKTLQERTEAVYKLEKQMKIGQRYRAEIQVRKNGLRVLLDGDDILTWRGEFKRLGMEDAFKLRDPRHLGIGSWARAVSFHRVEVWEVTPSGIFPANNTSPSMASDPKPAPSATLASAPPTTAPQSAPMKAVETPADPRLTQLEAGFRARYEADAQKPYLAAVAALNQSYINSGLARARAAAQAGGNLDEVAALDAEKGLIERGQSLPATDADGASASLLQLRKTYREALAKHAADREAKAVPLYAIYVKALDDYVVELTKANRIDEAQKVRQLRDEIAKNGVARQDSQGTEAKAGSALTLFDGKSLDGWTKAGDSAAFSVNAGTIRANGPKGNLYYVGSGAQPPAWKDLSLTMKVKTNEKANSGLWVHANAGGAAIAAALEVQIANGNRDVEKTGSIYAVKGVDLQHVKDDEWFDLRVVVKGKTITVFINNKEVNTWTQPAQWQPPGRVPNARLGEGTIGLQSNGGTVWFKDIQITPG